MAHLTPLQRCQAALRGKPVDRPPFLPAIYEHKAWFVGQSPSRVACDADLFLRAVLAEYERIQPDALTIGLDVYNIEAEAAGCRVAFAPDDPAHIPGITPDGHAIRPGHSLDDRPVPNPLTDGRMPLLVEVTRQTVARLGSEVWVRGALSGPFSLAVSLMGATDVFMGVIEDPASIARLLAYAARIIKQFGQAYLDAGAGVILFDSQASADLLPPKLFESLVLPVIREIVDFFHAQGAGDVPLIIGGNTTPIRDACLATGANNLLCDFTADWPSWRAQAEPAHRAVRRNLDPRFLAKASPEDVYAAAAKMIAEADGFAGFLVGTAVVPYGTPTANLAAVHQACVDAGADQPTGP